jgi:hypothetical protein
MPNPITLLNRGDRSDPNDHIDFGRVAPVGGGGLGRLEGEASGGVAAGELVDEGVEVGVGSLGVAELLVTRA